MRGDAGQGTPDAYERRDRRRGARVVDWLFIDYPTLTGLAVWGSIFVVVLSFVMDLVLLRLDPRVRAAR